MKRATIRLRKLFKGKDKHINLSPRLCMIVNLATQVTGKSALTLCAVLHLSWA